MSVPHNDCKASFAPLFVQSRCPSALRSPGENGWGSAFDLSNWGCPAFGPMSH